MTLDFIFGIAGLILLFLGGEYLVKGSANLALSLGISTGIVGLTVVAIGTSSPELVVSLLAAVNGRGALSLGNIVGSNMANIGLIVGLTALIMPISIQWKFLKRDMPVMILAFIFYFIFALSGTITRMNGIVLLGGLFIYLLFYALLIIKSCNNKSLNSSCDVNLKQPETSKKIDLIRIIAGIAFLMLGGHLLVESATGIALAFGVSEWVIAISMVAVGTSLPELSTSIVAAVRGYPEMVIGNVIGSNIFNVLFVQAAVAVVQPVPVQWSFVTFEFPIMVGAGFLMYLILRTDYRVSRIEGGLLLAGYIVVILMSFMRNPMV
ncbi:calcium/sodium antiporter [Desulfitibacter alkalitolerans]|uniref:calcium/sodium antiporter n=1 Tax=Desulfitibacter alkalitolerans TaxID=264641 RepID=UPI000487D57B|nr:calcium/sodium antiporter [Desulfitibacter alkalitolerans]